MEPVLCALDEARRSALRALVSFEPVRRIFVSPRHRIPIAAALCVASSALLALLCPLVSLWLGAALLGVPHVVSGLRHVVARRDLHAVTRTLAGGGFLAGVAFVAGAPAWTMIAFTLLFAAGMAVEALAAPAPWMLRAAVLGLVAAGTLTALAYPWSSLVIISHLHALSSVAFVAVAARRRGIVLWPAAAAVVVLSALALLGGLDSLLPVTPWVPHSVADAILGEAQGAAFVGTGELMLRRALFLYAFGQALHYSVWLRLMPEVDRRSPVPYSLRRAWQIWRQDMGRWAVPALAACALAAPLMLAGGGVARDTYFALVYFHVGLEAAALVRLTLGPVRPA